MNRTFIETHFNPNHIWLRCSLNVLAGGTYSHVSVLPNTLVFFAALFVLMEALAELGLLDAIGQAVE